MKKKIMLAVLCLSLGGVPQHLLQQRQTQGQRRYSEQKNVEDVAGAAHLELLIHSMVHGGVPDIHRRVGIIQI